MTKSIRIFFEAFCAFIGVFGFGIIMLNGVFADLTLLEKILFLVVSLATAAFPIARSFIKKKQATVQGSRLVIFKGAKIFDEFDLSNGNTRVVVGINHVRIIAGSLIRQFRLKDFDNKSLQLLSSL